MSITNVSKPSTTFSNSDRVVGAETWASIETTWASETRTWTGVGSSLVNVSKNRTLGSYTFDEIGTDTIDSHGGAMDDSSGIINTSKP